jgi:hypothetical protein
MLDYATAATFLAMAYGFRCRHPRAASLALANGLSVLGLSLCTDYAGGLARWISFRGHGVVDMCQAAFTGLGPVLFGFGRDAAAQAFYAQAALEAGVVAATDFSAPRGRGPATGLS